jgi:hypothetical protein
MSTVNSMLHPAHGSFLGKLRAAREALDNSPPEDPWVPVLRNLKGRVGADGIERISTYDVFDTLEVPVRRRASLTVRLSRAMRTAGWRNIRAHGLTSHSYRDRVRGYAREVPGHPATVRLPNGF